SPPCAANAARTAQRAVPTIVWQGHRAAMSPAAFSGRKEVVSHLTIRDRPLALLTQRGRRSGDCLERFVASGWLARQREVSSLSILIQAATRLCPPACPNTRKIKQTPGSSPVFNFAKHTAATLGCSVRLVRHRR